MLLHKVYLPIVDRNLRSERRRRISIEKCIRILNECLENACDFLTDECQVEAAILEALDFCEHRHRDLSRSNTHDGSCYALTHSFCSQIASLSRYARNLIARMRIMAHQMSLWTIPTVNFPLISDAR